MRNIFKIILIFPILILGMSACDDGERELDEIYLEITSADYQFKSFGGEGSATVESTGNAVTAVSSDSWLEITGVSGTTINYRVDQFYEMSSRTAVIYLKSGNLTAELNVTQLGAVISVDTEYLYFNRASNSLEISVTSDDIPYTISNSASWLTMTSEEFTGDLDSEDLITTYTYTTTTNSDRVNRLDTIVISFNREGYQGELRVPVSQVGTMQFSSYNGSKFIMTSVDGYGNPQQDIEFTFSGDDTASVNRYIATTSEWDYPLIFNYSNGFLRLIGGTRLLEISRVVDEESVVAYWTVVFRDTVNGYLGQVGGMVGIPYYDEVTDTISFRFVDDGSAKTFNPNGFFISVYTEEGRSLDDNRDLESAYIYPVLTLDES